MHYPLYSMFICYSIDLFWICFLCIFQMWVSHVEVRALDLSTLRVCLFLLTSLKLMRVYYPLGVSLLGLCILLCALCLMGTNRVHSQSKEWEELGSAGRPQLVLHWCACSKLSQPFSLNASQLPLVRLHNPQKGERFLCLQGSLW